tara:strand:- start:3852 stop:4700 length:849 start_codon:yes stop_codon:yes gene_type:complete
MTGYGRAIVDLPSKTMLIEIRSLNSKSLDLNLRIPNELRSRELEIRKLVAKQLKRGKIDVSIYAQKIKTQSCTKINSKIIEGYIKKLKSIDSAAELTELLKIAVGLPDAISNEKREINKKNWAMIITGINKCLNDIESYRIVDGKAMLKDFKLRIAAIQKNLFRVIKIDPKRVKNIRSKVKKSMLSIKAEIDQNRFEQELIYYIEKLDINEEKTRLQNNLDHFLKTLKVKQSSGKKLSFICQEIGREINTIGSKANFYPIQKHVVQMKDELEKIKEQLFNIL